MRVESHLGSRLRKNPPHVPLGRGLLAQTTKSPPKNSFQRSLSLIYHEIETRSQKGSLEHTLRQRLDSIRVVPFASDGRRRRYGAQYGIPRTARQAPGLRVARTRVPNALHRHRIHGVFGNHKVEILRGVWRHVVHIVVDLHVRDPAFGGAEIGAAGAFDEIFQPYFVVVVGPCVGTAPGVYLKPEVDAPLGTG